MQILPADPDGIRAAIKMLHSGGVVAHATETCYGLACDLSNPKAVRRLFAVKDRPGTQPVSALFTSLDQAKQFVVWNDRAEELAKEFLPGPLTLILPLQESAREFIFASVEQLRATGDEQRDPRRPSPPSDRGRAGETRNRTLGIRISSHPVAQALVTGFSRPVSTTSANVHGQPNPYSVKDIISQFESRDAQPDIVLDSGVLPPTPPSKVIDLSQEGDERVLRQA